MQLFEMTVFIALSFYFFFSHLVFLFPGYGALFRFSFCVCIKFSDWFTRAQTHTFFLIKVSFSSLSTLVWKIPIFFFFFFFEILCQFFFPNWSKSLSLYQSVNSLIVNDNFKKIVWISWMLLDNGNRTPTTPSPLPPLMGFLGGIMSCYCFRRKHSCVNRLSMQQPIFFNWWI